MYEFLARFRRRPARRNPADLPDRQSHTQALQEAADWVITARPEDDYPGRTLTPGMVRREVLIRSGLEVAEEEAAVILEARLQFRGYR